MAGDILWERHSAVFRFLLDKTFFIGNHKLILLFCRAVMRIAQHRILQRCSQFITAWAKGNECDASADHAPNKGNVFLRLCLREIRDIMTLSQQRGCRHGEITASV